MIKYNTGNPVGSADPRDLYDNATVADEYVNSTDATTTDRLGVERATIAGIDADARAAIANAGYIFVGDYAAGIELTGYNQVVRDTSGEFWRVSGSTALPYTTTGAGLPEGGAFVAVGDAALRQELAGTVASGQGANLVNGATIYVGSVAELEALSLAEGVNVYLTEDGRAGEFVVKTGTPPSDPQKGIYIVLANGNYAERQYSESVNVKWFGASGDGVTDDTARIQAAIDFSVALRTSITPNGNENNITVIGLGPFSVTNTITIPRTAGNGPITGINLYINLVVNSWEGAPETPVLNLNNVKSRFKINLDCGSTGAAGILIENAYDQVHDNIQVYRFSGYGLKYTGTTGNCEFINPTVQQYRPEHSEFPNFTSPCVVVDAGDCRFRGGNIAWGLVPLLIEDGAYNNLFIGTHIWTGGTTSNKTIEATIIKSNTSNGAWFHDCYLDNGHVDCFKDGIHFSGGLFVNDDSVATVTNPIIRYYGDGGAQPFFTSQENWIGRFGGVGAFQNPDTLDEYLGDWSLINSFTPEAGASSNVFNARRTVFPHNIISECDRIQVPGGGYRAAYDIGPVTSLFEVLSDGTMTWKTDNGGWSLFSGDGRFRPNADVSQDLGGPAFRLREIYAQNSTINTSDEREKTQIQNLSETESLIAKSLKGMIRKFKWKDAVAQKGGRARWHFGVIAQEVKSVFEDHGLNGFEYGLLCYDEWEAEPEVYSPDGTLVTKAKPSGDRYGVRYDELLAFIISAL